MVSGVRNDDSSPGEVTDHAAQAGVVLFSPEQRVLDHQWRLTAALRRILVRNLTEILLILICRIEENDSRRRGTCLILSSPWRC